MTNTIKLSEDFKKAVSILRQFEELTKEFKDVFDELDQDEKNLVGGLVIGVYSPIKKAPKFQAISGSKIYCEGLISDISNEVKKRGGKVPSFADLLKEYFP